MYYSSTIFGQVVSFLPKGQFKAFVGQHKGDRYCKRMDAWNQFMILMYAQATGKESLRDIETGLKLNQELWYHLGIESVAKSTLARANKKRSSKIFEKLFYATLAQCRDITPTRTFDFDNPLYSLDSTTVELCFSLFNWATYQQAKGAFKIHTLFHHQREIPTVLVGTTGNVNDVVEGRKMTDSIPRGSIVVFDRGYLDFTWWSALNVKGVFFVTRTRSNRLLVKTGVHHNPHNSLLADDLVFLGDIERTKYPQELRRIIWKTNEGKKYEFITNNFALTGEQIAFVYKDRWQIELFFKWIKQNLKIKTFLGTSRNAVMTQVWVAMTYYLILSYIKFQTKFEPSLLALTRMIKETIFTRRSIIDLLSLTEKTVGKIQETTPIQMRLKV